MGHVPLLYSICSRHHHPDSLPSQPSYIAHHDPPSLWMFLWPTWQWMPLQKSQMLCPMLVASKHVVLPCGVLNIHCHHHQSVKVCCSLEHPLYKWRQYFNGMLAQTSIALPLLPIVPSQFCQANSAKWLCCVSLGVYSSCNPNCRSLLFNLWWNNLSPEFSILMNLVKIDLYFHHLINSQALPSPVFQACHSGSALYDITDCILPWITKPLMVIIDVPLLSVADWRKGGFIRQSIYSEQFK